MATTTIHTNSTPVQWAIADAAQWEQELSSKIKNLIQAKNYAEKNQKYWIKATIITLLLTTAIATLIAGHLNSLTKTGMGQAVLILGTTAGYMTINGFCFYRIKKWNRIKQLCEDNIDSATICRNQIKSAAFQQWAQQHQISHKKMCFEELTLWAKFEQSLKLLATKNK